MSSTKFPVGTRVYYFGEYGENIGKKIYGTVVDSQSPDSYRVWANWHSGPKPTSSTSVGFMPEDKVFSDEPLINVGTLVVFQFDDEPEMCMTETQFNDYYANVKDITILAKVPWAKGQGL